MLKSRKTKTKLLVEATTEKVVEAISDVSAKLTSKKIREIRNIIDTSIKEYYEQLFQTEIAGKNMSSINPRRIEIAHIYGVDPAAVTDEFLAKKIEEENAKAEEALSNHTKKIGIELNPDTPEFRKQLKTKVQRIASANKH